MIFGIVDPYFPLDWFLPSRMLTLIGKQSKRLENNWHTGHAHQGKGRPCEAKMIGLTAWRQRRSTFTHWRLRGRGGLCLTDLAVHFAPDWSKKYFSLGCCLPAPEIEGGADRREQKSTFTGRRIRGQRRSRRANGRAVDVATPPHCCCSFALPRRLCQIPQQTHGQPHTLRHV